jgi:hypothetical protein
MGNGAFAEVRKCYAMKNIPHSGGLSCNSETIRPTPRASPLVCACSSLPGGAAGWEDALKAGLSPAEGCVIQLQDFMIIAGSGFVVASVAIWLVWLSRRHRSVFLKYIRERPN